MIRHLITLLWNSRRKFIGIIVEQALVFIVLTICMVTLFDMIRQYREPGLLDTENVVLFGFMADQTMARDKEKCREINQAVDACIGNMRQWDNVESTSESLSLVPYLREPGFYHTDSVMISGNKFQAEVKFADIDAQQVFNIEMEEGEWLPTLPNRARPAVITRKLADQVGSNYNLIGAQFSDKRNITYTITGIVSGIKESVFAPSGPGVIIPKEKTAYNAFSRYREICARVKPGQVEEFCNASYLEFQRLVPYFNEIEFIIRDMGIFKAKNMFPATSRLKLLFIPTLFLLIFAFIGTLGLLMLNVKKRAQEFGIHRAVGASSIQLLWWMVVQSLLLTLIASIPGIILSFFIFSVTATHLLAILTAVGAMLVFSLVSAYYPAWQITKINPAVVLHQE